MDNVTNQSPKSSQLITVFFCLSLSILSFLFCFYWKSYQLNTTVFETLSFFANGLYHPHHNYFIVDIIGDDDIMKLYYQFMFFTIFMALLIYPLLNKIGRFKQALDAKKVITTISIIFLLIFAIFQQYNRFMVISFKKLYWSEKDTHEKLLYLFGEDYDFPTFCRRQISGRHQGKLISDLDFTSEEMFIKRMLAYYLYPSISIRYNNNTPEDILIIYHKENPYQHIPKGYSILAQSQNGLHILAMKNKEAQ